MDTKRELPKVLEKVIEDLFFSLKRVPAKGTAYNILKREMERALELYGQDYDVDKFKQRYERCLK